MNVDEIIKYQPTGSIDESEQNEKKFGQSKDKFLNKILSQNNLKKQYNYLDDNWVNKMIIQFDRKLIKNQEQRIKYTNEPTNFLNSEIELFDILQEMHALPAVPEFYDILIENRVISNLLGLLDHENTDIVVAVINLLFEFSDNEAESENLDKEQLMLQALIDGQTIKCIISVLQRLDENVKEERDAVNNALTIIESLSDYDPEVIKDCEPLIVWILQRLKSKLPFNENKLSACETLSILLQNEESNKVIFGNQNGIDTLLQQIALYKKNLPESVSEEEYIQNLFGCLCSSLLDCNENRKLFFEGEGIELMNIILRDKHKKGKKAIRTGALKVLNYLFTNNDQDESFLSSCSNRFIEILGLKAIFPIFMVPKSVVSTKKKFKNDEDIEKIEEYSLLIILASIKYARKNIRTRCLYKFVENNFEKIERLVELYFKYAEKIIKCEQKINKEKTKIIAEDGEIDEEHFFFKRLSAGLFTLQLICQLIVILCSEDVKNSILEVVQLDQDIKTKLMKQINMRALSQTNHHKFIGRYVQEVIDNEKDDKQKNYLQSLLNEF